MQRLNLGLLCLLNWQMGSLITTSAIWEAPFTLKMCSFPLIYLVHILLDICLCTIFHFLVLMYFIYGAILNSNFNSLSLVYKKAIDFFVY